MIDLNRFVKYGLAIILFFAVTLGFLYLAKDGVDISFFTDLKNSNQYEGQWQLLSSYNNDEVICYNDEFLSFDEKNITYFSNGEQQKIVSYQEKKDVVTVGNNVIIYMKQITNELYQFKCVGLQKDDTYLNVLKVTELTSLAPDLNCLNGKWNVLCHGGNVPIDEQIIIDNNVISTYINGRSEPESQESFICFENLITIGDAVYYINLLDSEQLIVSEKATGYIWFLKRINR